MKGCEMLSTGEGQAQPPFIPNRGPYEVKCGPSAGGNYKRLAFLVAAPQLPLATSGDREEEDMSIAERAYHNNVRFARCTQASRRGWANWARIHVSIGVCPKALQRAAVRRTKPAGEILHCPVLLRFSRRGACRPCHPQPAST